eukprot:TRINITY_DN3362_c0_g1_i15.p1 TRINITY_DN3362_c0_g1~~TRINITY_DN3362_c0_g1_i15.p1  ORF type:complete len:639 (-),score=20.78 TRINITY_DN3362_c0_g1_i15:349-2265(-)
MASTTTFWLTIALVPLILAAGRTDQAEASLDSVGMTPALELVTLKNGEREALNDQSNGQAEEKGAAALQTRADVLSGDLAESVWRWMRKADQVAFWPSNAPKMKRHAGGVYNTVERCQDQCFVDFGIDCRAVEWEGTDCRTYARGECCSDDCKRAAGCQHPDCLPTENPWTSPCTDAQLRDKCTGLANECLKTPASRFDSTGSGRAVWFLALFSRPSSDAKYKTGVTVDTGCPLGVEANSFTLDPNPGTEAPEATSFQLWGGPTPEATSFHMQFYPRRGAQTFDFPEPHRARYWTLSTEYSDLTLPGFTLSACPGNVCKCLWDSDNDGVLDIDDTVPLSSKLMHLSSSYSRNRYPLSNLIDRDPLTFSRNGMYSLVDGASEFHHMRYPDWIEIDTGAVRSIASVTLTARSDLVPHACDAISETGCTLATGTLKTTKNLTMFKMLNHLFGRKGYTTEVRSQVDWCRPRGCMVGPGCSMLRHAHSDGGPALINVYYGAQKSDWQNVEQEKWWGGLTPAVRYCGIENGNISFWPDSDRDARYGADNLRVLVDGQECSIRSDLTAVGQSQTIPCALSGQLIRIENTLPNWPFNDPHVVPGASYANRMIYMISLAEITVNLAAPNIDKTHGWRQAARLGRRLD